MVKDKANEVILESIKRMVDECEECIDEAEPVRFDPIQRFVDPDDMKRLAALSSAMMRIISSTGRN